MYIMLSMSINPRKTKPLTKAQVFGKSELLQKPYYNSFAIDNLGKNMFRITLHDSISGSKKVVGEYYMEENTSIGISGDILRR